MNKEYLIKVNSPRFGVIEIIRNAEAGREFIVKKAGRIDCIYKSLDSAAGYLAMYSRNSELTYGSSRDIPVINKLPPANIQKIARRIRRYMYEYDYSNIVTQVESFDDYSMKALDMMIAADICCCDTGVIEYIERQIETANTEPDIYGDELKELSRIYSKLMPLYESVSA